MSDTDDTDDLLLIPPDFFLVHSEPEPPYYTIVDNLIKQVTNLQNRIETIETTSDVSLAGSHLDCSFEGQQNTIMFNTNNPSTRKYLSHDNLYQPSSTQSTPQKPLNKIRLSSLPNSPNMNRFSPRRSNVKFAQSPPRNNVSSIPKKTLADDPEVLHEIDSFLSNVKTIQRNHAARNLQNDFDTQTLLGSEASNSKNSSSSNSLPQSKDRDVQETINQLERRSQKILDEKKNLPRANINPNDNPIQERINKDSTWRCGDNIDSVPNYGAGVRNSLYQQKEPNEPPSKLKQIPENYQQTSSSTDFTSYTTLDKSTDSSSDSTQLTAYNKYAKEDLFKIDQKYKQFQRKQNMDRRLNDMFKVSHSDDPYKIEQERDELLQSPLHDNALSVLDMHQKLLETTNNAVKDGRVHKRRGINTLSDTLGLLSLADIWGSAHMTQSPHKINQKWQEEKLRRQHCEHLIQELQNKNLELQQKMAVAVKVDETKNNTIQQFREALEKVSARMEKLNEEKSTWDNETSRMKHQHAIEIESANQKIVFYEKEASKALNLAHTNQEKISSLEKRCSDLQNELDSIEYKFKEVEENYKTEFDKNKQLADIVSQKEIELRENKSVLNNARDEVSQSRKAVEICQAEFTALKSECAKLQSDLKQEKNAIITLNEQKRKLLNDVQTYKTNEKVLKEALEQSKAKLESTKVELRNFYQGQLEIIVENKRKEMQSQLDSERQHNLEELKRKELSMAKTAANHIKEISEKCTLETKLLEQKHDEEIRLYQMHLAKYKSEIDNLQAKLANLPEKRAQIAKQLQKVMETQWNEALKMISSSPSSFSSDHQAFNSVNELQPKQTFTNVNNVLMQQKVPDHYESDYDDTPVSSRGPKQSESEIQKYINMLLNRPPGNPMTEPQETKKTHSHDRVTWHQGAQESQNKSENTKESSKERRHDKPPWK